MPALEAPPSPHLTQVPVRSDGLGRVVWTRAGRTSLRLWVGATETEDPALLSKAEAAYDACAPRLPWPERTALRAHLVFSVLPGAALYATLREHQQGPVAVATVADALAAMAAPRRRLLELLTRHAAGRTVFLRLVAAGTPVLFPDPGWQRAWVERSGSRVAFDMTRCFDLDMLRRLDMAELTPAYCDVDDVLYAGLCPYLRWERTGTLAGGAAVCDFRFARVPPPQPSEPSLTPSRVSGGVCPWWFTPSFDNPLRRALHPPEELLGRYVRHGSRVVDIGPGLGYFTVPLARLVGDDGVVIAADVQPRMLAGTRRRADRAGVGGRVRTHLCRPDRLGLTGTADFVLAFWMLHEARDPGALLGEIRAILAPGGTMLLVEPVGHVTRSRFEAEVREAQAQGFRASRGPPVRLSRTAVLTIDH